MQTVIVGILQQVRLDSAVYYYWNFAVGAVGQCRLLLLEISIRRSKVVEATLLKFGIKCNDGVLTLYYLMADILSSLLLDV